MKQKNEDIFSEIMSIIGKWIWYVVKFLLAIIFLVTKLTEWLLHAFNAVLMNVIKLKEN